MGFFKDWLPYSGRRFQISRDGFVYTDDGVQLESCLVDGQNVVELEWLFGKRHYSIGLLVYVTFRTIELPEHLWLNLEILYFDGCPKNCDVSNLTYRFKDGPLEVENIPGFYYVPFHEAYGINREGVLLNTAIGRPLTWYVTKPCIKRNSTGGYCSARVSINKGERSAMLFRHKALCLAFKRYGNDVQSLIVNHLDGDPTNDHLDNIEWCTYAQNNKHAYMLGLRPNSAKPIFVKDISSGEISKIPTMEEAKRVHGKIIRHLYYKKGDVITDGKISVSKDLDKLMSHGPDN